MEIVSDLVQQVNISENEANKTEDKVYISENEVLDILHNAPKKYKVYTIPKRTSGHRVIAHPSKELKKLQRAFNRFYSLPIHPSAMAYKAKVSIKDNALFHSKQQYLLKMDFTNFFNSITPELFWNEWLKHFKTAPELRQKIWITNLLFWRKKNDTLVLSVGAPSSPSISNFCMFAFDEIILEYCKSKGISFTRYADDLTFSSNKKDILFSTPNFVESVLSKLFNTQMYINHSKTIFSSKGHNRHVTGITITNEGSISLGRERKRYIKHLVHQFKLSYLDKEDMEHLKGLLAFAKHIEPKFFTSLQEKYTKNLINRIFENKYE